MCIPCQSVPCIVSDQHHYVYALTQTNKLYVTVLPTMLTSSKLIKPELKSVEEIQSQDFEGEDESPNAKLTTKEPTAKELITEKKGTPVEKALEND